MFHRLRFLAFVATICLGPVATCGAAEIKVLNANALTIAMKEIVADFTKETGHQVSFVGVSPGQVEQRIRAGEVYDLVITATASAIAFEQEGRWRPGTRHPLARVGIGVAVRNGTKLDLSSVDAIRKALLDAKAITYSDSSTGGLSGANAQKVLANLGLSDALKGNYVNLRIMRTCLRRRRLGNHSRRDDVNIIRAPGESSSVRPVPGSAGLRLRRAAASPAPALSW
jgi:molybdate transport system substrate-binding protein